MAVLLLVCCQLVLYSDHAFAAACATPATDYGTVTGSVDVPAAATYRIWTRMSVPDSTSKTYLLEVDGNTCFNVGGGNLTANSWTWVAYQGGNASSHTDVSLTAGVHSYKLIGNTPGVKVDRLVLTSDMNCTPQSVSGTECNVSTDTSAPSVRITAPASGATVSGSTTITATASDNVSVARVDFYANSSLISSDTTAPYSAVWDTTKVPNESQLISVRAYDASNNVGTDSITVASSNGDTVAPSAPSSLKAQATAYNAVTLNWKASTDNTGVAGYSITRDGVPLANTGNVTTYSDKGLNANTTYSYKIAAFDAAGNKSAYTASVRVTTPKVADTQAPSAPKDLTAQVGGSTQVTLNWTASTDNIGVTGYDVYRGKGKAKPTMVASSPVTSFGDANLAANTTYSYYIVAKDASGNASQPSEIVTVTTEKSAGSAQNLILRGIVTDASSDKVVDYPAVIVTIDGHRHFYQGNRYGAYAVRGLASGHYNLTYRAPGYYSKTIAVELDGSQVITEKDITLQKRQGK